MTIALVWIKDQQYLASDDNGHGIVVESRMDRVSAGFSPSQLLLVAAAGCTANHVIAILKKKRLPPVRLRVLADGVRAEAHPRRYTAIKLRFEVHGAIPKGTVDDVIRLAQEKYCSVLNSIDPGTNINITSIVFPA